MTEPILKVDDLHVSFHTGDGVVHAVNGISFEVAPGETLGVVGESGSGKSVTQLALMGLLPSPPAKIGSGTAKFKGRDLLKMDPESLRKVRGKEVAMIFQDPMTSLNPFLKISTQLTEVLEIHTDLTPAERRKQAIEMLEKVGIPDAAGRIDAYPHQFSGGMRQRVMIAMALMCNPELLIADEPTTALDVTIQAQILELMKELREDFGASIILITHDLGVVAGMAHRILVMYAGSMMEYAETDELFAHTAHPYTIGLLNSIPRLDATDKTDLVPISGQPPDLARLPPGCPFKARCPFASTECDGKLPDLREVRPGHWVRCVHAEDVLASREVA